jgi:hypothetical protein
MFSDTDTTTPILFQIIFLAMMVVFATVYYIKDMVVISTVLGVSFLAILAQIITINCFARQNMKG